VVIVTIVNLTDVIMESALTRALEAADADAVLAALADDVTLRVAVHDEPFVGRDAAAFVLRTVLAGALHGIEITETFGEQPQVIGFRARVAGYLDPADGLLLARPEADGRIADLTVYLRPLPALQALADEMGRRLGAV
jgi:hypothetical protein